MHAPAALSGQRRVAFVSQPKELAPTPELIAAIREIVRYALMTMHSLQDPDRRYLGWAKMPVAIVHDTQEAYGYSAPRVRRFQPTPGDITQMEKVLPWLAWLRQTEGVDAARRIIAWALGAPLWALGQRERCSDRTVLNRIDRSMCLIIKRFLRIDIEIEHIEEPYKGVSYAIIFDEPDGTSDGDVKPAKIYIGGKGFYRTKGDGKRGKWLDDGQRKYNLEKIS